MNTAAEYRKTFIEKLNWPFLWNNYSASDYITGYVEDGPYTTFKYVKKGFNKQVNNSYNMPNFFRFR